MRQLARLQHFIHYLPPDSATALSLAPEGAEWRTNEELLATLIEVVDFGNRNFIAAHSERSARLPSPLKIPRPYTRAPESEFRKLTATDVAAILGKTVN